MLAVEIKYRKKGIGKKLVLNLLKILKDIYDVNEYSIETEVDNYVALYLYESLGFLELKFLLIII